MRNLPDRTTIFVQDLADQAKTPLVLALGPLGGGRNYFYIDDFRVQNGIASATHGEQVVARFPVRSTAWLVLGASVLDMLTTAELMQQQRRDREQLEAAEETPASEPDVPLRDPGGYL